MDEESCRHQKTTLPHTPEDLLLFPAGMEKACQLWRLEKNLGPKISCEEWEAQDKAAADLLPPACFLLKMRPSFSLNPFL